MSIQQTIINSNKSLFLLFFLFEIVCNFTFLPPTISVNPLTINVLSTYIFIVDRDYDITLQATAWNTSLVPAGSNIQIIFPSQYVLNSSQLPSVNSLMINSALVTQSISVSLSGLYTLVISNAITTASAIATVTIILDNVLNPSPAITTGTFVIKIGNDLSSNLTGVATVTLQYGLFSFCSISFTPSFVNSTAPMILNITPTNKIPITGKVIVTFPSSLQWSQDVSTNHQLPLDSVSTCKVTSSQISNVTCSGMTSTQQVSFTFVALTNATYITQNIILQIDGLFSPPTTSPPDSLTISSYSSSGYQIDQCSSLITGLIPKNLSVGIIGTSSPMYINSFTGLNFTFTTLDTIVKADYFTISFPLNSTIAYTFKVSNFLLGTVTYSVGNNSLTFLQLSSSSTKFANTPSYIMFLNYKAPLTTKTTTPITLTVWNSNGHKKMEGSSTLTAIQKQYQISSVATSNNSINSLSTYIITINISDTISGDGMIQIQLPPQLKSSQTGNLSVCPSMNLTSASNLSCSFGVTQKIIVIKNIWTSTPNLPLIVTISVLNIVNINYQTYLSAFVVNLYYSTDKQDLVATYTQNTITNSLLILAQPLNTGLISVTLSNYTLLAQNVSYTINFSIKNSVPANGFIYIELPSSSLIETNIATCSIVLNTITYNSSCLWVNSTNLSNATAIKVKISINALTLSKNDQISVVIHSCCVNPTKTRPIQLNQITTHTSNTNLIDYFYSSLSNNTAYTNQFINLPSSQMSLIGQSLNDLLTTIFISFTQPQQIDQINSYLIVNIISTSLVYSNSFFALNSTPICSMMSNSQNVTAFQITNCTLSSTSTIKIFFPLLFVIQNNLLAPIPFNCNISVTLFKNPPSFAPFTVKLTLATYDSYFYSVGTFSSATTQASNFASISYDFSSRIYQTTTNLSITINDTNLAITKKFVLIQLAQYFSKGTLIFDCSVNNYTILWQLTNTDNQLAITLSNSSQVFENPIIINLVNLYVPLLNLTNLQLQSFQETYLISQDNSIHFSTTCNMPCKQCPGILFPDICTACFENSSISKNKYLYNETCLQICPIGTYSFVASVYYQYICQLCNQTCYTCQIIAQNCTSCNYSLSSNYPYLYNNQCLKQCPNTTFANITSLINTCQKCVYPCANCANTTLCITCQSGLIFYKTLCLASCPLNITVLSADSSQCLDCAPQCQICQNKTTTCLKCHSNGSKLFVPSLLTCVSVCPTSTVLDTTLTKCVTCKLPCLSCSFVQYNCTSCINNTFLSQLTQGQCLTTCETFYFQNTITNQCQLCSSAINCRNCSSATQCLSCDGGMGYVYFPINMSCLTIVPPGYVNLSGIAVVCQVNCTQCIQTTTKCTKCSGIYYLDLIANLCSTTCPVQFVGLNNLCIDCTNPCLQCAVSTTNCTKCISVYYLLNFANTTQQNRCYMQCPDTYYNNVLLNSTICSACVSPCVLCTSNISCLSCEANLFLFNNKCQSVCPNQTLTNINKSTCDSCLAPCLNCVNQTYICLTCTNSYYYQGELFRCYLPQNCPSLITVANSLNQTCDKCLSPCLTCQNTTQFCLSCISNFYLNSVNSCVSSCDSGFYASLGFCLVCESPCQTCTSKAICESCLVGFYSYQFNSNSSLQCVSSCPASFNIVINNTCTPCLQYCVNCSSTNVCYQCQANSILYNQSCVQSCPPNLIYYYNSSTNKKECLTQNQYAQNSLTTTLSLSSILPMPFLIIGSILFVAGLMSKLQHQDTWIIGWGYVVFGTMQIGSIVYLLYIYANNYDYTQPGHQLLLYMLLGVIGFVFFLNFLSLACVTHYLTQDANFSEWMSTSSTQIKQNATHDSISIETAQNDSQSSDSICCENSTSFIMFTILAFLISYKVKIIFFTRLFQFTCMSATLQNPQKFRIFNTLSFLGVLQQGVTIYILYKILTGYSNGSTLFLPSLDCLIVTIMCIILAMISTNKQQDFFKPTKNKELGSHSKLVDDFKKKDKLAKKNFKLGNHPIHKGLDSNHVLKQEQEEDSDVQIQQLNIKTNSKLSKMLAPVKGSNNKVKNVFLEQNQNFSTLKKSKTIQSSLIASKVHKSPQKLSKINSKLKSPNKQYVSSYQQQNVQSELKYPKKGSKNKYGPKSHVNNSKESMWAEVNVNKYHRSPPKQQNWVEVDSSKKFKKQHGMSPKQRVDLFNPYLHPTIQRKQRDQQISSKIEEQSSMIPSITSKTKKRSRNSRNSIGTRGIQDALQVNRANSRNALSQQQDDFDQICLSKSKSKIVIESNQQSSFQKGVIYQEDTVQNKSFQPMLPFVHQQGELKYTSKLNKNQEQNRNIFQLDQDEAEQENQEQESKKDDSLLEEAINNQVTRKQINNKSLNVKTGINSPKQTKKQIFQQENDAIQDKNNILKNQNYQTINKTLKQLSEQFQNHQQLASAKTQQQKVYQSFQQNQKQQFADLKEESLLQLQNQQKQYNIKSQIPQYKNNGNQIQKSQQKLDKTYENKKQKITKHPSKIFKGEKGKQINQSSKMQIGSKIQQKEQQLKNIKKSTQKINQINNKKKQSKRNLRKSSDLRKQIQDLRQSKQKKCAGQEQILNIDEHNNQIQKPQSQLYTKKNDNRQKEDQNKIKQTKENNFEDQNKIKQTKENNFKDQNKIKQTKENNFEKSQSEIEQKHQIQDSKVKNQHQQSSTKQIVYEVSNQLKSKAEDNTNNKQKQYGKQMSVQPKQQNQVNLNQQENKIIIEDGRFNSIQTILHSDNNQNQQRANPLKQNIEIQQSDQYAQRRSEIVFQKPIDQIYKANNKAKVIQQQIPYNHLKKIQQQQNFIIQQDDQPDLKTIDQKKNQNYQNLLKLMNKKSQFLKHPKKSMPKQQKDQKINARFKIQEDTNSRYKPHPSRRFGESHQANCQNKAIIRSRVQINLNQDQNIDKKYSAQKKKVFQDKNKNSAQTIQDMKEDILASKRRVGSSNKSLSAGDINLHSISKNKQISEINENNNKKSKISLNVNTKKLEQYLPLNYNNQLNPLSNLIHHQKQFDSEAELKQWKDKFASQPQQFINMKQEHSKNNIPIKPVVYSQNEHRQTDRFSESIIEDMDQFGDSVAKNKKQQIHYDFDQNDNQDHQDDQIDPYDPQFYYQMLNKNGKIQSNIPRQNRQKSRERKPNQDKQKRKRQLQKIYRGYYAT